ncbi:MAG TPA: hypothetical protein PLH91_14810, partial [Tenuifilaceae bacterium]|nr:hypothetical protein [Tenuifilaceae bacterium]
FTGEVVEVTNIGEQLPNTDAKVFEVVIRVNEYDPILRPSMTTGNQVITNVYDSVMYIPLEALHADDSVSYVFTKKGKKQVVVPGDMNENYIIVEKGLSVDDEIYISMPEKPEKFDLVGEELIPVLKEKALKKKQDEEKLRQDQEMAIKAKADAQKMMMQFAPGGSMVKGDKPANDTKKSDRGDRKRESK